MSARHRNAHSNQRQTAKPPCGGFVCGGVRSGLLYLFYLRINYEYITFIVNKDISGKKVPHFKLAVLESPFLSCLFKSAALFLGHGFCYALFCFEAASI